MDPAPALRCHGITKHYPHFSLRGIGLAFKQGAVMGLIGPNGAGKSTIMRLVMDLLQPDAGTIEVMGYAMPEQQIAAKRHVGFIAEDMRLYDTESVQFHMDFVRSIFDTWDGAYANALLRRLDLKAHQTIKGLSHGQRVKVTLLLALARRPRSAKSDNKPSPTSPCSFCKPSRPVPSC